jgi:hypothetical protein
MLRMNKTTKNWNKIKQKNKMKSKSKLKMKMLEELLSLYSIEHFYLLSMASQQAEEVRFRGETLEGPPHRSPLQEP